MRNNTEREAPAPLRPQEPPQAPHLQPDMPTRLLPADAAAVQEAAALLRQGQVVAIPTETVYGLAANALDEAAVYRIFEAKGRPQDNPLIVHIAGVDMLEEVAKDIPAGAYALAEAFWPGPLTMVLPASGSTAPAVSAGLASVGVRMPSHPVALAVIREAGVPLAAPSANRSGSPSPTRAAHVLADLSGRIPLVLDGGPCRVGVESTVLSLLDEPVVLRPGAVTPEAMAAVLGRPVLVAQTATAPLAPGEVAVSPGIKYRHYAPKAQVVMVEGSLKDFAAYAETHKAPGVYALCFEGEEEALPVPAVTYGRAGDDASQAAALFAALRALDEQGAVTVLARSPSTAGVGLAVYNRLLRAAAFRVVRL